MKRDIIEKCRLEYVTTDISVKALADKYPVSYHTLKEYAARDKWLKQRMDKKKLIYEKTEEKTTERIIDRKVAANEKHIELYDKALEIADLILAKYMEDLHSGKGFNKTQANAYNLDFITKAIKNAQSGQRLAMSIKEDNTEEATEPEIMVIEGLDMGKI